MMWHTLFDYCGYKYRRDLTSLYIKWDNMYLYLFLNMMSLRIYVTIQNSANKDCQEIGLNNIL